MKIIVTGANGLLGHHVVFQLIELGYDVSVIVRSRKNIFFDLNKVIVFEGDFTNKDHLMKAATSCDAIIHLAAITTTNLVHYNDYQLVNTTGAENVLKVAEELNINRIVYVSTSNTIGFGSVENPTDENCNIEFPFSKSFYAQSKLEAEKLFVHASKKTNQHIIIINPTFIIGSFDTKPSSGKLILMGYKKRLMFVPAGGKNFVAASDVAIAVCNALTLGKNGERYLASGINLSFKEFYKIQSRLGGYKQNFIQIPTALLKMIGKIGDLIQFFGFKTEISSRNLNQLTIREYYKNNKAVKELKLPQKNIEIPINEALKWFSENGKTKI